MKRINIVLLMLIGLNVSFKNVEGQINAGSKPSADFMYGEMVQIQRDINPFKRLDNLIYQNYKSTDPKDSIVRATYVIDRHLLMQQWIKQGLNFWKDYPNDPRRFELFKSPYLMGMSRFWKNLEEGIKTVGASNVSRQGTLFAYNVPLNLKALAEWEQIYATMRNEYIQYLSSDEKRTVSSNNMAVLHDFYTVELRAFIKQNKNEAYRKNGKIDLDKLRKLMQNGAEFAKYFDENFGKDKSLNPYRMSSFHNALNYDLASYQFLGLSNDEMARFVASFKTDKNPFLRKWAEGKIGLFSLMDKERLTIKYQAIDGRKVDLDKLIGKVVLLDFWSLQCSGCIDRMPIIRKVYDKYKDQGFEVISVNTNTMAHEEEFEAVKGVEHKVGASWPTLMLGPIRGTSIEVFKKSLLGQMIDKYGLQGVPQLLLLDKQGKLILHNHNLSSGRFPEELVEKLLKEPYTPGKGEKSK